MAIRVELLLAMVLLPLLLLESVVPYAAAEKVWVDRDKVYCGHLDCTRVATFKGERFCTLCDTRHFCECKETREPLPYMYACPGTEPCQSSDRLGSCSKTMHDVLCDRIDQAFLEQ
uniref:Salivary gland protein 6 n=1 Tax=Anopheles quadriannulatus TaxID=34691 RepID=A0A182WYB2_ANOQN